MRAMRNGDGRRHRFDIVTIGLHWTTAALISFQAATGLSLQFGEAMIPMRPFIDVHRAGGTAIWLVVLARILWRSSFARIPPFPARMSVMRQFLARHTEHFLYLLLLVQPVSGFALSLMLGKPFSLFVWVVPAVRWANLDYLPALETAHLVGAYALFAVGGGHAATALLHHYVFKDDVLERMAPWVRQRGLPLASSLAAPPIANSLLADKPRPESNVLQ